MSADSDLALWLIPLNIWLVANLIVTFHYVIKDEGPDFLRITEIFWMILSLINTNQDRMKETMCLCCLHLALHAGNLSVQNFIWEWVSHAGVQIELILMCNKLICPSESLLEVKELHFTLAL